MSLRDSPDGNSTPFQHRRTISETASEKEAMLFDSKTLMQRISMGELVSGTYKDKQLEEELKASLIDGHLPCAVAFEIAAKLRVARRAVGRAADRLGIRIINCQLGCFKFEKAVRNDLNGKDIDEAVAQRVRTSLVNGCLPCALAFKIVRELRVNPNSIGDAANKLKVKIANCQLGCFL